MKSILMFAAHFPPASTAGVHRTLRFVKYLQEFECVPTVVTRSVPTEPGGLELEKQIPCGVRIMRTGGSLGKDGDSSRSTQKSKACSKTFTKTYLKPFAKRLILPPIEFVTETPDPYVNWVRQAVSAGRELIAENSFDVLYTTGPPHSSHLIGLKLARLTGLPWIADFRDPWSRFNWPKTRNPWGQRLQPWFERRVVRSATRLILNNESSRADFVKTYPDQRPEKFIAIANGFDPDLRQLVSQLTGRVTPSFVNRPSSTQSQPPVICHPGTLYRQRTPRSTLAAVRQLRDEGQDVAFLQIGSYSEDCNPQRIGEELGVKDLVTCIPKLPHEDVLSEMSRASLLLAIQPNAPLQVPGKLYEMLLYDTPILAVCDSEATSQIIDSAGHALAVPSNDVQGIATAIRRLLGPFTQDQLNKRLSARDRYDGRALTERLSEIVHELASNGSASAFG